MPQTVTVVDAGGRWKMLFVGDECIEEDHSLDTARVLQLLEAVDYDEVRSWDATASKTDTSFVEYEDQVAQHLRKHGVSFLFE